MELYFCIHFDLLLMMKYFHEFTMPKDLDGDKWTKRQQEEYMTNNKVEYHIKITLL